MSSQDAATKDGWYFVIPESSPMLRYQPYADGGPGGWNSTGGSHLTSAQSASIALDFYGDGLQLFGSYNASYTVQIDDDNPMSVPVPGNKATIDGLFVTHSLALGAHTAVVTVTSDDPTLVLSLYRAVVFNSKNNDILNRTPIHIDCLDPHMTFGGIQNAWEVVQDSTFALNDRQQYLRSDSQDSYYTFNFTGTRAFSVYSSLTGLHGRTQISINDEKVELENKRVVTVNRALRFFRDGLDEDQEYVVTFKAINLARLTMTEARLYGSKVAVGGQAFFTDPNSTSSGSSVNVGAIAGGVVGGVLGLLLLAALGVFFFLRKRKQHESERIPTEEYTEAIETSPFPYETAMTQFHPNTSTSKAHLQPQRLNAVSPSTPPPAPASSSSIPSGSNHTDPNRTNMDLETALGVLVRSIDRPAPAEPVRYHDASSESPPQYRH